MSESPSASIRFGPVLSLGAFVSLTSDDGDQTQDVSTRLASAMSMSIFGQQYRANIEDKTKEKYTRESESGWDIPRYKRHLSKKYPQHSPTDE